MKRIPHLAIVFGLGLSAAAGNLVAAPTVKTLYSFGPLPGIDGYNPYAALVQGSDGNFYGTTISGGADGNGTVFRIGPGDSFTNLYSFLSSGGGQSPYGGLVQGSDGNFYGTTASTVFRMTPDGSLTNIHVLSGSDGSDPHATLVQGSDSNFYGTSYSGGAHGVGAVFRISPGGSYTNLYSFTIGSDGIRPSAGLVQDTGGKFYGTTTFGGMNSAGTVFRISPGGSYTNLFSFSHSVGLFPYGRLVQGSDGNFYGTTTGGGVSTNNCNCGTVFQITPGGSLTTLHSFTGSDGSHPYAGLAQGADGIFYGTTRDGGSNGYGNVFKLVVPLSSPANQISALRVAGTNVVITIPSVADETYQLQYLGSLTTGVWSNVVGASNKSIGGLLTVTNFGGALLPQRFYRFSIIP